MLSTTILGSLDSVLVVGALRRLDVASRNRILTFLVANELAFQVREVNSGSFVASDESFH